MAKNKNKRNHKRLGINLSKMRIFVHLYLQFNMSFRDRKYILCLPCSSHKSMYTHNVSFIITTHTHSIRKILTDQKLCWPYTVNLENTFLLIFCTAQQLWPPSKIFQHFHLNYFQNTGVQVPKYIFTFYRQWWLCLPLKLTSSMHLYKEYSGWQWPHNKKHHMKQRRSKNVDFQPKTNLHHGN